MTKTPVKDRIRTFIAHMNVGNKPFEIQCGQSNGWVRLESEPTATALTKIMNQFPQLSPDWLLTGYGPMIRNLREHPSVVNIPEEEEDNINKVSEFSPRDEMVTLPSSTLKSIQSQLEEKDKQISQLLAIISKSNAQTSPNE